MIIVRMLAWWHRRAIHQRLEWLMENYPDAGFEPCRYVASPAGRLTMAGWRHIATWDASRRSCPGGYGCLFWGEICEWALAHGADSDTWRYEIWVLDTPIARILRYAQNADGRRYIDAGQGEPAQQQVKIEPLNELPPGHLRVNADAEGHDCCPRVEVPDFTGQPYATPGEAEEAGRAYRASLGGAIPTVPGAPAPGHGFLDGLPQVVEIIPLQPKANLGRKAPRS